jgi:hypothetical protein
MIEKAREMAAWSAEHGLPPAAVAAVIATALTARRPRTRYVVGRDARIQAAAARLLPDRVLDALVRRTFG